MARNWSALYVRKLVRHAKDLGLSQRELANRLGLTSQTIHTKLAEYKVEWWRPQRGKKQAEMVAPDKTWCVNLMAWARVNDATWDATAFKAGITVVELRGILEKHGVAWWKPKKATPVPRPWEYQP